MVEAEGAKGGPITQERQFEMSIKSSALFEKHGVDFYEFMHNVTEELAERRR